MSDQTHHALSADPIFNALAQALPVAIYTTDAAGFVTFCNDAAATLAGRRPEIGCDRWCVTWRLYWPDGRFLPHDECPMAVALKENRVIRGAEAVAERPNGTRFSFTPFPTPICNLAGEVVGGINVLLDITDRKNAEKLRKVTAETNDRKLFATLRLVETILMEAQQAARGPEARILIAGAGQRIAAINASHGLLAESDPRGRIDMWDLLSAICVTVQDALPKGLQLRCETTAGDLSAETAMPLALIVRELIASALDQGGAEGFQRVIKIALGAELGSYELTVEDSGGALKFEGSPFGLRLVEALTRQINGTIDVDRVTGARCTVRFREAQTLN